MIDKSWPLLINKLRMAQRASQRYHTNCQFTNLSLLDALTNNEMLNDETRKKKQTSDGESESDVHFSVYREYYKSNCNFQ